MPKPSCLLKIRTKVLKIGRIRPRWEGAEKQSIMRRDKWIITRPWSGEMRSACWWGGEYIWNKFLLWGHSFLLCLLIEWMNNSEVCLNLERYYSGLLTVSDIVADQWEYKSGKVLFIFFLILPSPTPLFSFFKNNSGTFYGDQVTVHY